MINKLLIQIRNYTIQTLHFYKWIKLSKSKYIYLNLGSGPTKSKNKYLNIDKYKSDIWHDLRKSIPLKPESVDEFYSSHFLEHLSPDDLAKLLDHILKLLKKNGKFLICVPNIRIYIEAYMAGDRIRKGDEYYNHYNTETKLDELNYMAHMNGEHKYLFDEENIISMLEKVGFSKVLLRDFDHKIDLEHHKFESIYVEAIK